MELVTYILGVAQGFGIAYIVYAPDSAFKRGFIDGLTFKFIWKHFRSQ